jgi:hypothetical protein
MYYSTRCEDELANGYNKRLVKKLSSKKILIVYNEFPSIAKNLSKAFEAIGYEVDVFYGTQHSHWFYRLVIRVLSRWARALRLLPKGSVLWPDHHLNFYNYIDRQFQNKFNQFSPDYLLVIHGLPFSYQFIADQKIPKLGWWIEPNDDLQELERNSKPFHIYNSFSLSSIAVLQSSNKYTNYLSHAVSTEDFNPLNVSKDLDVVFVGNWSPWREEVLLRVLDVTQNIKIYGPQWLKKSRIPKRLLKKIYGSELIIGSELNHLLNSAKVNLNALRIHGTSGLNMRFFEVLATKSLFLTDFVPEISRHFIDGQELLVYKDLDDLTFQLKKVLCDESLRLNIAENGYQTVLNRYTYDHLAKIFEGQFKSLS